MVVVPPDEDEDDDEDEEVDLPLIDCLGALAELAT